MAAYLHDIERLLEMSSSELCALGLPGFYQPFVLADFEPVFQVAAETKRLGLLFRRGGRDCSH